MTFLKVFTSFVLLTFAYISSGASPSAYAQQIDLTMTPPTLEVLIKPDTQLSIPYTITNRADNIGLRPMIKIFSIVKQGESVEYGSVEKLPIKFSFADENSESINAFMVNKGGAKKIFLQVDVLENAPEGDYHLSFLVETQPEFLDKQFSSRIKSQIASPLLITVTKTGKTQVRGAISIFKIGGNLFDSFDPIPVTLLVKNKGKNVVNVGGGLTARGSFGESAVYPLQNQNILAGAEKLMTTQLAKDDSTLTLKGFFVGRYGVSASVMLADGTVQLNKSSSFFAFPFKIVAVAVLGSFVGIMVLRKRR